MEENTNIESVEIQEVAEPVESDVVESEESQEVAEPETTDINQRDYEKDAAFAKLRRELEAERAAKLQIEETNKRLAQTYNNFGFKGTPEEIIDQANAHYLGKSVDEVRQQRLAEEQKTQEELKLQHELEFYKNREIERMMQDDLSKIQKIDPEVKSLDDLGPEFLNLIKAGVDAELAFGVVNQKRQKETKKPPADIGKVNSKTVVEKDFFTPDEVDNLSPAELDNPKILEKVMKSMTKWK